MSDSTMNQSRRRFVVSSGGAIGVAALASVLSRTAQAADPPFVNPNDANAKALFYIEDATKSTNPKHKPGDDCAICNFFAVSKTNPGAGTCTIFPGKWVHTKGWCATYIKKP